MQRNDAPANDRHEVRQRAELPVAVASSGRMSRSGERHRMFDRRDRRATFI
jgi:hypothetical protein